MPSAIDKEPHLTADLPPACVRVADKNRRPSSKILKRYFVADFQAVGPAHACQHRAQPRDGDQIAAANKLIVQQNEIFEARLRMRIVVETVDRNERGT